MRFCECAAEIGIKPHDLAGRLHLWPQQNIDAGEPVEGEYRLLDGDMSNFTPSDAIGLQSEVSEALAGHHSRRELGDGDPRRLGDEGHGAAGPGVNLDDVNLVILDRELDVHQTNHAQGHRKGRRLLFDLGDDR